MIINRTEFTRRGALFLAAGAMALSAGGASALAPNEAESFVAEVIGEMRKLIDNDAKGAEGAAEFLALLEKRAAIDSVGKFAVGRTWREMSDAQQKAYLTAFRSYISQTYQNRFGDYAGEDIVVTGSTDAGKKGIIVKSDLVRPKGGPLKVDWVVTDRTGSPLLADVMFEGVSLAITLRETFGGMLEKRKGDVDGFIADLAASSGA